MALRKLFAHGCLLLLGVAGGGLLVLWALAFHPSNEQLWMVPVGLVLLGTPVFVWLSDVLAASSDVCPCFELRHAASAPTPQAAPSPVLDP